MPAQNCGAYRFKDESLLVRVSRLTAGKRRHWYCVVWTMTESASGDDGVFDPDVHVPLVEQARQVFKVVKVAELGVLGGSVLHAQTHNLISIFEGTQPFVMWETMSLFLAEGNT